MQSELTNSRSPLYALFLEIIKEQPLQYIREDFVGVGECEKRDATYTYISSKSESVQVSIAFLCAITIINMTNAMGSSLSLIHSLSNPSFLPRSS